MFYSKDLNFVSLVAWHTPYFEVGLSAFKATHRLVSVSYRGQAF